ncbi:MAG: phosphatidylserine decarboxylase [Rhodocyclaceae bacterium]|nr:phosphatidylserine decarboxylase [Rhodocyclaceae bacterium]
MLLPGLQGLSAWRFPWLGCQRLSASIDSAVKISLIRRFFAQEDVNFLLCNRVPRRLLTLCMGWYSQVTQPWVVRMSLRAWQWFGDLELEDARRRDFRSLHDCFTRELAPGARPVAADPSLMTSPCDAIVGACGTVEDGLVIQAKGFPYGIDELFGDARSSLPFHDGTYVTLRLTSGMYHRFHAPDACTVEHVTYLSGDTWNVNPVALQRIERLFCRNERAVLRLRLDAGGYPVALVPVAAILVASIRLHFADVLLHLRYRGPNEIPCDARFARGQEMGYFQHGSTIIVFAPRGFALCEGVEPGQRIRMGAPLMALPVLPPR